MKLKKNLKMAAYLLSLIFAFIFISCSKLPVAPLGEELVAKGEQETISAVTKLLTDILRKQYKGKKFLRDTHPKDNGCVKAKFIVDQDIDPEYQHVTCPL